MQRLLSPVAVIVAGVAGGIYIWEPLLREEKEARELREKKAAADSAASQHIAAQQTTQDGFSGSQPVQNSNSSSWTSLMWSNPPQGSDKAK